MESFLAQVAAHIRSRFGTDTAGLCVVMPNRRAGLYLQRALARQYEKPIFAPAILGLQDFIVQSSEAVMPDKLSLLFALYEAYTTHFAHESFEQFYPWGEMLLADFDELDKYGVEPTRLFVNLQQAKLMEQSMAFSVTELERFKEFWSSFSNRQLSEHQNRFMELWERLPAIYAAFRQKLAQHNWSYEGAMARALAQQLGQHPALPATLPYAHIVFAGLHAPAKTEQQVMDALVAAGLATTLYDADAYYVQDVPLHEAGHYFRSGAANGMGTLPRHFGQHAQTIQVVGAGMRMGQARAAGSIVAQLLAQGSRLENTAIVLPDESLLLPLLYSLPPGVEKLNVTMGYPLAGSPVHTLLQSQLQLWRNARRDADGRLVAFNIRDVQALADHAYVQLLQHSPADEALDAMLKTQAAYLPAAAVAGAVGATLRPMFALDTGKPAQALAAAIGVLGTLISQWADTDADSTQLEQQATGHVLGTLLRLRATLADYLATLSLEDFVRLVVQSTANLRVPFTGEPLQGLQVMGFLETRALDFENVIVLGLNENVLPPKRHAHSFIPYNLRKSYGLPTLEDNDGVTAYHFYRLLQRAANIYLLYDDTGAREDAAGEKSRYLLQLEMELQPAFKDTIRLEQHSLHVPMVPAATPPIRVEKTGEVAQRLAAFYATGEAEEPLVAFSPSMLQTYVACPLQFYYRYVAGLKEPPEPEDELGNKVFGNVFHAAMEALYRPLVGQVVTPGTIEALRAHVEETVRAAAEKELPGLRTEVTGRNLIRLQVLNRLVHEVLGHDQAHAPFRVVAIEQPLARDLPLADGRRARIAGRADRIDEKDGVARILDYKTGHVEPASPKKLADTFADARYKEALQAATYAWLYAPNNEAVQVGIVPLRKIVEGLRYPIPEDERYVLQTVMQDGLQQLVGGLLDDEQAFVQTDDKAVCDYCPYYRLCYRS
jgi:CRISPR/Cas system-associated exonuclease Cas4 (RecB family)